MKLKIKSMEEYSEAKIYKSKPELRNSNVQYHLKVFTHFPHSHRGASTHH